VSSPFTLYHSDESDGLIFILDSPAQLISIEITRKARCATSLYWSLIVDVHLSVADFRSFRQCPCRVFDIAELKS
jgi:hypothetical protein